MVQLGVLSGRSLSEWEETIVDQPLHYIRPELIVKIGSAPRVLSAWPEQVRADVCRAALDRLVRYFDRNVSGGF